MAGRRWLSLPNCGARAGKVGFTSLPITRMGIQFTNHVSKLGLAKRSNLTNGSGVALGDVNGDGLCDIYFCRLEETISFISMGNLRFHLEENGAAATGYLTRGAAFADLDGDNDLDSGLTTFRKGTLCLNNDGNGVFADVTKDVGLESMSSGTSVALGDVDRDGDLDLYVANFGELGCDRRGAKSRRENDRDRHAKRLKIINDKIVELGEADAFYLNKAMASFSGAVATKLFRSPGGDPIAEPIDFGLSVQIRDINADGLRHLRLQRFPDAGSILVE